MPRGNATTDDGTARTRRTPGEIAQAELDKADKRLEKANAKLADAENAVEPARNEVARAQRFRDFAASNPDLPATGEPAPAA